MKQHTEYMPDPKIDDEGIIPKIGEKFLFHGALLEAVDSGVRGCDACVALVLPEKVGSSEKSICQELPPCAGVTFIYRRQANRREFKTWLVIKRMGLDDEA